MSPRDRILIIAGTAYVALAAAAIPAAAQDNVEGPWGIANGDIYGRARLADVDLTFGTGTGVEVAWEFLPPNHGAVRPVRSQIVFDAAGNLYFRGSTSGTLALNNKMVSVAPDGTHRWNAKEANGSDFNFGTLFSGTSPIVGVERVYGLGSGNYDPADGLDDPVIAAFSKATGAFIWERTLPEPIVWGGGAQLQPILYNGKIYVIGEGFNNGGGQTAVNVYQVDAATGVINWDDTLAIAGLVGGAPIKHSGTTALAPEIFGNAPGLHGLFFNGNGGNDADAPEMYAIQVSSMGATLAWTAEGGKAARSHVIYNPDGPGGPRLYTATWNDYGSAFYSYDPVTGAAVEAPNVNNGHGFYDTASLSFDNATVIAGAFNGTVINYVDAGTSVEQDVYPFTDWFGEYRTFGTLLQDYAGNPVVIAGTNSRVNDLGSDFTARVVALNMGLAQIPQDGAMYIDNVVVSYDDDPSDGDPAVVAFTADFNALSNGDLPGQDGWEDDRVPPSGDFGPVQVIDDPTGTGDGKVVALDAAGNSGGWTGTFHDFDDITAGTGYVTIQYEQFRPQLTENVWPYFGGLVNDFSEGWAFAWDCNLAYYPYHFADTGGSTVPQVAGVWQTVTFTYHRLGDPVVGARTVTVDINGATGVPVNQLQGFGPTGAIRGFGIQVEGTPPTSGAVPNHAMVEYDTGVGGPGFDHGFVIKSGPVVGPDGKIYFVPNANNSAIEKIVALKPITYKGDADCDDVFDGEDIGAFVLAVLEGQAAWEAQYGCNFLGACDANNDSVVDDDDVPAFVNGLLN